MPGLEFGNCAAVDLGTGLARVDHDEAVQRLVALDEALACLGAFPGCQLEQLDIPCPLIPRSARCFATSSWISCRLNRLYNSS
jgi:hypothetical protein